MQYTTTHPVHEAAPPAKVLMSTTVDGKSFQVVEQPDGTLTIAISGTAPPHYRWAPAQVEACIRTYMRVIRR